VAGPGGIVLSAAASRELFAALRPGDPNTQEAGPPGFGPSPATNHQPGGDVVSQQLLVPAFMPTEQLYRTLPDGSWFDASVAPNRPVQWQFGAYTVPKGMAYWITDYSFRVFRFSGIDPGDIVPAEEGRFSSIMGFDININGRRFADLLFQLDPVPVQVQLPAFAPPAGHRAQAEQFNTNAAQSFAANTNIGTSLLPVRAEKYGPEDGPFTLIAGEGTVVALNGAIFRRVPSPIAAIEGRHAGFKLHTNAAEAIIQRMRLR
jgi:hypothetical protein